MATGLTAAGPVNSSAPGAPFPANGLPAWYQDSNGLALQGCLDNTPLGSLSPMCVLPIILEEDYDFHLPIAYNGGLTPDLVAFPNGPPAGPTAGLNGGIVNYPSETFYYYVSSNPKIPLPIGTGSVSLVLMALEGAYVTKDGRQLQQSPPLPANSKAIGNSRPVETTQGVFQRFKIIMDNTPVAGNYTFTHPWGSTVFNCPTAGAICKFIQDIPLGTPLNFLSSPDPALGGNTLGSIGPFMVSALPTAPATPAPLISNPNGNQFIGNPTVVGTNGVIPGTCATCNRDVNGFSFMRIDGPAGSGLTTGNVNEFFIGGQIVGLGVSPASGTVPGIWKVGATSTSSATFTVTNTTGAPATLTLASSNPAFTIPAATDHCTTSPPAVPPAVQAVPPLPSAPPGNTCSFDVLFAPSLDGTASSDLTISAAGAPPAKVTVSGTGDGILPTLAISPASRIVNTPSPTISGTASDANGISSVSVAVNGGTPQSATITGSNWSLANALGLNPDAGNSIVVTASDNAQPAPGNQKSLSDTVTVDTIAPVVAINNVTSPTKNTNQAISGTASDANGISSVTVSLNGTLLGSATVAGGSWSFNLTGMIPNAGNSVTATATDTAGNAATSAPSTIAVDTVVSPFTLTAVSSPTRNLTPAIGGSIEAGSTVTVAVNGGAPQAATVTGSSWSFTASLTNEGSNSIVVSATDAAGNSATLPTATLVRDTVVSPFTLNAVTSPAKAAQTIGGSVEAGSTVAVAVSGGAPQQATITGSTWSFPLLLTGPDGSKGIVVSASDPLGNSATLPSASISLDTTPPSVKIDALASATTSLGSQAITGTVSDANGVSSVSVNVNGTLQGPATLNAATGTWSFTVKSLQPNLLTSLTATAADSAGNQATSAPVTITLVAPHDGDMNLDGVVDITDALLALRTSVGLGSPTPEQKAHGDVAPLDAAVPPKPLGDGKVDVADALLILRKVVNLVSF